MIDKIIIFIFYIVNIYYGFKSVLLINLYTETNSIKTLLKGISFLLAIILSMNLIKWWPLIIGFLMVYLIERNSKIGYKKWRVN